MTFEKKFAKRWMSWINAESILLIAGIAASNFRHRQQGHAARSGSFKVEAETPPLNSGAR
jgi:hypothetical protein